MTTILKFTITCGICGTTYRCSATEYLIGFINDHEHEKCGRKGPFEKTCQKEMHHVGMCEYISPQYTLLWI